MDAFRHWDKLEKIKCSLSPTTLPMGLYVLRSADLSHLKELRMDGVTAEELKSVSCSLLKASLQTLNNAPRLTHLHLYECTINLKDMEMIHANIPNLKVLYLDWATLDKIPDSNAVVSGDCMRLISHDGSDIVKTSADSLLNFYLHFKGNFNDSFLQSTIKKRIIFIGIKYGNLVLLSVERCVWKKLTYLLSLKILSKNLSKRPSPT